MSAWRNEPGIVFLDRLNKDNVLIELGEVRAPILVVTTLLPYESCNLGSINPPRWSEVDGEYVLNYAKLARIVDSAVHFLDNVIDVNKYPLPQIEKK